MVEFLREFLGYLAPFAVAILVVAGAEFLQKRSDTANDLSPAAKRAAVVSASYLITFALSKFGLGPEAIAGLSPELSEQLVATVSALIAQLYHSADQQKKLADAVTEPRHDPGT